MIAWEVYMPFIMKSNDDLWLKRYSEEELDAMVRSLGELFMKTIERSKRDLLTKIINDIYLIHYNHQNS